MDYGHILINCVEGGTDLIQIDVLYLLVKEEQRAEEYFILVSEEIGGIAS